MKKRIGDHGRYPRLVKTPTKPLYTGPASDGGVSVRVFQTWAVVLFVLVAAPLSAGGEDGENETSLRVFYDHGFRLGLAGDAFSLRINGLLQIRYSYVDYDQAIRYNQEDYSNFFVRRARLYFSGHAGNPRFTYFVHVQLEPSQGLNSNDLWVECSFSDMLRLGAGRNKISYGLELLELPPTCVRLRRGWLQPRPPLPLSRLVCRRGVGHRVL